MTLLSHDHDLCSLLWHRKQHAEIKKLKQLSNGHLPEYSLKCGEPKVKVLECGLKSTAILLLGSVAAKTKNELNSLRKEAFGKWKMLSWREHLAS